LIPLPVKSFSTHFLRPNFEAKQPQVHARPPYFALNFWPITSPLPKASAGVMFCPMRTVTKQQAAQSFDKVGDLAHAGETVIVTHGGKPWIKLVPVATQRTGKSAAAFKARLNRISPKPIPGVTEVLSRLRR
jgi:antitoxin (DNA-binding transcriptional repressor) of toxin-antitoxin stability system